jgi:hypothetical protein
MKQVVKQSIAVCAAAMGLFITSCDKTQPVSTFTEQSIQHQADRNYACIMHPEITGEKGDKCSKCGMELQLLENGSPRNIEVKIGTTPEKIEAGIETQLSTTIIKDGEIAPLDIVHEKQIHMLIVDEELTWFDHIHPEEQVNGNYTVTETFPHSGNYYVYADFKPRGSAGFVHKQVLKVNGSDQPITDTIENKWVSQVDGYTVILINGNDFQTNRPQHIGIRIEKNGHSITSDDIEPYLGAIAHVVIIGKKDKEMLHVHPESNEHVPIHGETLFEKPGIYKMWVQFQLEGKVNTADFTVSVIEGSETIESHHHDSGNPHNH